jgi:hypothetical protein
VIIFRIESTESRYVLFQYLSRVGTVHCGHGDDRLPTRIHRPVSVVVLRLIVDLRFGGWLHPDARRPPVCPAFPLWFSGRDPCRAMVGSGGAWSVDRGVQVGPGRFPGPLLGQVQGQAARGAGEPGGNVDRD